VIIGVRRGHTAPRGSFQKTELQEVRLHNIHDRIRFFTDGCANGIQSYRTAAKLFYNRLQHAAIKIVQPQLINLQKV
jgi:hypothetical protein